MTVCCGKQCDLAFCPVCGSKLVKNEFVGMTEQYLGQLIEEASHNLRWAESGLRDAEKQANEIVEPAKSRLSDVQQKLQRIREARDYARQHGVTQEGHHN